MADVLIKGRTVWELPCGAAGLGIATALVLAQFLAQAWPEGKKKKKWNCGHRHTQGDHHVKMNAEILKNILSDINCSCPQLGLGSEQTLLYHHRSVCEQQKTESVYNQAGRKERFQA